MHLKNDMAKRVEKAKLQEVKYRDMPDIVVKVVCKYRAELFFKISRKTKLSRLFNAWTERMEGVTLSGSMKKGGQGASQVNGLTPGSKGSDTASTHTTGSGHSSNGLNGSLSSISFIFTHNGRSVEHDQTPEEAGMEDGDEILAVEMMDLTQGPTADDTVGLLFCPMANIHAFSFEGGHHRAKASAVTEELD